MTVEEAKNIPLPKWPQCVINGESVTKDQALEIIRRTDIFWWNEAMGGVNKTYNEYVRILVNYPVDDTSLDWEEYNKIKEKWEKDWGVVHTEYICNDWISTSFVDGPNGWCSPEGKIYYDLNIGKWPSYENIVSDLEILAKEFPFLKFTCTIMDREHSEEGGVPLYSFKVKNGTVTLIDPIPVDKLEIKEYNFERNFDYFCANINNPNRGIYFSLNQIKEWLKK